MAQDCRANRYYRPARITPSIPSIAASAINTHSDIVGMSALAAPTARAGALELLLLELGSLPDALTLAVLAIVPLVAVTVALRATVALAPLASVPRLQVTLVVPVQLPCDGVALTNCRPAGRTSVTTTFVAGDGPPLVTVSV